jgi:hypothetical protein
MTFGFPAQFSDNRSFSHSQVELSAMVKSALDNLGWQYKVLSEDEFRVDVAMSPLSWGEKLKIMILPGGMLQIESKCAYPLQCFDWGKNKKNVEKLFAEIKQFKGLMAITEEPPAAFNKNGMSPVERVFNEDEPD